MAFSHLLLVCFVGIAVAHDSCYAPGTTTTVTSTTTTTVSGAGGSSLIGGADAELIRSTWAQARKDGDVAPQILFRFLKRNPAQQKKFPGFANVPQDQLMKNGNFLSQAYTIMAGLNVVVQSAGSQELLAQQIQQLGAAHSTRGVTPADLDMMADVIVEVLEDELHISSAAKQAWQNGLRALAAGVAKNLKSGDDLADPRTGLTPRQIQMVQSSWERVRSNRAAAVSATFLKMFKEQPSYQSKFNKFDDVPVDSLPGNAEFNKQVNLVADRIDHIVSDMSSPLKISGEINYMAYSHKPRGVGRSEMEVLNRILMEKLGFSGAEQDAWRQVLGTMAAAIARIQKQ